MGSKITAVTGNSEFQAAEYLHLPGRELPFFFWGGGGGGVRRFKGFLGSCRIQFYMFVIRKPNKD